SSPSGSTAIGLAPPPYWTVQSGLNAPLANERGKTEFGASLTKSWSCTASTARFSAFGDPVALRVGATSPSAAAGRARWRVSAGTAVEALFTITWWFFGSHATAKVVPSWVLVEPSMSRTGVVTPKVRSKASSTYEVRIAQYQPCSGSTARSV